jgi:hypothetical protein
MAQEEGMGLSSLTSPSDKRPLSFTIVAPGGMGKTTLGSLFPSPVFIRTEDGTRSIQGRRDVALFPVSTSVSDVMHCMESLMQEAHSFKSLIIDSATRFNIMVEAEVLALDGKAKGLNQALGGYGNAYDAVSKIHLDLRNYAEYLMEKRGMNIVFLAHACTETVEPPDGDTYTRYSIPLHKKSLPHYTDSVDVVAFIKQKVYTGGEAGKRKMATTDGSRVVTCYPCPSHVSKNRLGIKEDLPFVEGVNPFADYLQ